MSKETVVISGIGMISAAGGSARETLESFAAGRRCAEPVSAVDADLTHPLFRARGLRGGADDRKMRTALLTTHAVAEALDSARLDSVTMTTKRVGVCLGTTVACQLNDMDFVSEFRETGAAPMGPIDRFLDGNLASQASRELGLKGPTTTVTNACTSGADAIGIAASWIRAGMCDIAIAGGADELSWIPISGFLSLSILSPELCAPFDVDRQGLNLGEGAGIVVLESLSSARGRGADTDLSVAGFGTICDSYHLTAPRPDGKFLKEAIRSALSQAEISARDVAFVNAHGTATPDNDKVEGAALAEVFGQDILVVSTKGYTGHTLGASGALEAAFSALALREGWIPACAGFEKEDPEIPIRPTTEKTNVSGRYALSTSLAFNGGNTAIIIGFEGKNAERACTSTA